jgi:hypothetical protein
MLTQFPVHLSVLHNQCYSSPKDYKIVADVFINNYLEVKYFDENSKESCGSVVSGMQ